MSEGTNAPPAGATVAGLDDGELARRIAAAGGSPAAEEEGELCRRFARRLVYFGRRLLGSEDRARDLAQDALLLTLQKLRAGEVREPERIGAFVLGVARTLAGRRRQREARSEPLDAADTQLVATCLTPPDPIARKRVEPCIEALPDKHRAVILLSFYGEQSSGEVADSLGLTRNHVRVLRHRGVARLRDCLFAGREAA